MEEPRVENKFLALPDEIKDKIFALLPMKSCQLLRIVCSEFRKLIDLLEVPINNETYEWVVNLKNIDFAKIQNLTIEISTPSMFNNTIRRLDFCDVVVSYNMFPLLAECKVLQVLSFKNITLDTQKKMACPDGLTLANVTTINFDLKRNVEFTSHELILIDLLRQIKFKKLYEVIIPRRPLWRLRDELEVLDYLLDNVQLVEVPGIKSTALLEFLLANCQNVKKITIGAKQLRAFGTGSQIDDFAQTIGNLQFEEMKCWSREPGLFTGNESLLIEHQKNLVKIDISIDIDGRCCWSALVKALQASSFSLIEVKINFNYQIDVDPHFQREYSLGYPVFDTLDFSVFTPCSKLEILYVGYTHFPFINFNSLPATIQTIDVLTGRFTKEDLLLIVSGHENLSVLKFNSLVKISNDNTLDILDIDFMQRFLQNTGPRFECMKITWILLSDEDVILNFGNKYDGLDITFVSDSDPNYLRNFTCKISENFNRNSLNPQKL